MIPVPRQKLDKLVTKMRHYDIHPIYLPDIDYMYGESHPLNAQLNDLVSELQEYLLIANDDELRSTYDVLDSYWREQVQLASLLKRDAQTTKLVATYLIVSLGKVQKRTKELDSVSRGSCQKTPRKVW